MRGTGEGAVIEMGGCHLSVQRDNSKRGQNKGTAEESVYMCDCVCLCVCVGGGGDYTCVR